MDNARPRSCASCGVTECDLNVEQALAEVEFGLTAVLVDDYWPEFDQWLQQRNLATHWLMVPLDGQKWKKPAYAWTTLGYARVKTFPWFTLLRALESRRLTAQGAARQRALLAQNRRLAKSMARALSSSVTHIITTQNLLGELDLLGVLGGRTVTVLMTRNPLSVLQSTLDEASRGRPDGSTLTDFRAPLAVIAAEQRALDRVNLFVTPHRGLAGIFPDRSHTLEWAAPRRPWPAPTPRAPGMPPRVGFLGPTLGRKGAFEVRDAFRELGRRLVVLGPVLEAPDFWSGLDVEHRPQISPAAAADLDVIVAPAWVDHAPRLLLAALASGRQVVATPKSGLARRQGLHLVPAGDTRALVDVLKVLLSPIQEGKE